MEKEREELNNANLSFHVEKVNTLFKKLVDEDKSGHQSQQGVTEDGASATASSAKESTPSHQTSSNQQSMIAFMDIPGDSEESKHELHVDVRSSSTTSIPGTPSPSHEHQNNLTILAEAAYQLAALIFGVDYRTIAQESVACMEAVIRMLKEGIKLAHSSDFVPMAVLMPHLTTFQKLLRETKEYIRGGNFAFSHAPANLENTFGGGGDVEAEEELYDVRLMHSKFAAMFPPSTDLEDEHILLKTRIAKLQEKNKDLEAALERSEAQHTSLVQKMQRESEMVSRIQQQMDEDIRQLATMAGVKPRSADLNVNTAYAFQPYPPSNLVSPMNGQTPPDVVYFPRMQRSSATGTPQALESPTGAALVPDRTVPPPPTVPASLHDVRYNKLDAVYNDIYRNNGMSMIWGAIECVYKTEYDTRNVGQQAVNEASPLPGATADATAYDHFKKDFLSEIVAGLESEKEFVDGICSAPPLRSDYVANCVSHKIKPNSGVIKMLACLPKDREIFEFSLGGNYIGDGGLAPILPLLQRLYRLEVLDLSDNGLKNSSMHQLCHSLATHPSVRVLKLGNNQLSRAGGKDLLTLASSNPRIVEIDVTGTQIDAALSLRLNQRTELNMKATSVSPSRVRKERLHSDASTVEPPEVPESSA